jgi:hypothetical protein
MKAQFLTTVEHDNIEISTNEIGEPSEITIALRDHLVAKVYETVQSVSHDIDRLRPNMIFPETHSIVVYGNVDNLLDLNKFHEQVYGFLVEACGNPDVPAPIEDEDNEDYANRLAEFFAPSALQSRDKGFTVAMEAVLALTDTTDSTGATVVKQPYLSAGGKSIGVFYAEGEVPYHDIFVKYFPRICAVEAVDIGVPVAFNAQFSDADDYYTSLYSSDKHNNALAVSTVLYKQYGLITYLD